MRLVYKFEYRSDTERLLKLCRISKDLYNLSGAGDIPEWKPEFL